MTTYEVEVKIRPWPEGGFLAEATDLQGCWVVSETIDRSIDDIREAIQLWVQARRQEGWPLPGALREASPDLNIRAVLPVGVP